MLSRTQNLSMRRQKRLEEGDDMADAASDPDSDGDTVKEKPKSAARGRGSRGGRGRGSRGGGSRGRGSTTRGGRGSRSKKNVENTTITSFVTTPAVPSPGLSFSSSGATKAVR